MILPCSHLRVYQPLAAFTPAERERWARYVEAGGPPPGPPLYRQVGFGDEGVVGVMYPSGGDNAFVRRVNGSWLVCPWRTRFRTLAGLLAFRGALPDDIADVFVPAPEAARVQAELDRVREAEPGIRSHVTSAAWHVPIRWFTAFEDAERIVTEEGVAVGVRYETDLGTGASRAARSLEILRGSGMSDEVIGPVAELVEWLHQFPASSLLELDYGGVAGLMGEEELRADRSAGELWASLEALESGDVEESRGRYGELAGWWAEIRSRETAN